MKLCRKIYFIFIKKSVVGSIRSDTFQPTIAIATAQMETVIIYCEGARTNNDMANYGNNNKLNNYNLNFV